MTTLKRWILAVVLTLAAPMSACAQDRSDELTWRADPHPDFAVMPRLGGEGADGINRFLAGLDDGAEHDRAQCLSLEGASNLDWNRTITAPFTGPRFLSVMLAEDYYCGGAHPSVDIRPLIFDRRTGGLPDWSVLWPSARITASLEGTGYWPSRSEAPALVDWYRAAVRADPEHDAVWLEQCEAHFGPDPIDEAVVLWLDAETGGVGMDLAWLAHAEMACGSAQVMPIDVAERLGAAPELIDALRRGHAEGAFRGNAAP
jgi:hypothetical protein